MRPSKIVLFLATGAALISLSGCNNRDEIKSYRIAKAPLEAPLPSQPPVDPAMPGAPAPMSPAMGSSPALSNAAVETSPSQISQQVPTGWQTQPRSAMRQASFLFKSGKSEVDISLVILGGPAGGQLDNVNRWLSQLGQPPITEEQLAKTAQHVTSPVGDVTVVDLKGLPGGGDPAKDGRIVAGFASSANKTFFFKMRGNQELAESQKGNFIKWIRSVNVAASDTSAQPNMPSGHPDISNSPSDSGAKKLQWNVPSGWKTAPVTSMRYASFSVPGKNGEAADMSVVDLPGEAGSDLDNVNRWHGQIGLPPVDDAGLQTLIVEIKGKSGAFSEVDMTSPKARTLAAWIRVDGHTWFFKLNGPDKLVESEKEKFAKFLQSVQFQP